MNFTRQNKCAMCGKESTSRDKQHKKEENEQQNFSTLIIEQINGVSYAFDTAHCSLIFKKFMEVYGSNFANEQ